MILGIELFQYKMVKLMTAGNKVLFLSVNKDIGMRRKILWLGSKYLKRRRHHQPTLLSSSTTSDSSTDEESYNDRFKIITDNEKLKWKLPKSMVNYVNKYFEEYVPEDCLN